MIGMAGATSAGASNETQHTTAYTLALSHLRMHHVDDSPRCRGLGRQSRAGSTHHAGVAEGSRPVAGVPLRHAPANGVHPRRDARPRPGQLLCLPFKVIRESLKFLKDEKCLQVDGGDLVGEVSYKFSLTDLGRKRAQDAHEQCAYVGPPPVPLEDYVEQCYRQAVTGSAVLPRSPARPRSAHLVLKEDMFNAIGPAIISGRSVFIYGPPGNGKTAMARAIGDFMNTTGGSIYVPYAFVADGNIVTVFDPSLHVVDDTPTSSGTRPTPPSASC